MAVDKFNQMLLKAMINSEYRNTLNNNIERLGMENEVLLSEVIKVSRLANLNAMEIVHWSLLLDNCEWKDEELNYKKLLRVTALQIKVRS